jgi:hypothetical protein
VLCDSSADAIAVMQKRLTDIPVVSLSPSA